MDTAMPEDVRLEHLKRILQQIVLYNLNDEVTRRTAENIIDAYEVPQKAWLEEIVAVWDWVRTEVRYTFDPRGIERFQTADRTLDTRHGDCDDQATLVASLLASIGHEAAIFLCDTNPFAVGRISHAVAGARLPKPRAPWGRKWIILETTKDVPFGWKPKATRWEMVRIDPNDIAEGEDSLMDVDEIPYLQKYRIRFPEVP